MTKKTPFKNIEAVTFTMHDKPPVGEPCLIDDERTFNKYITWDNLPLRIEIHDATFKSSNVINTWIEIHKYKFVGRNVKEMTTIFEREDI